MLMLITVAVNACNQFKADSQEEAFSLPLRIRRPCLLSARCGFKFQTDTEQPVWAVDCDYRL